MIAFYNSLNVEQKAKFDAVLQHQGRRRDR